MSRHAQTLAFMILTTSLRLAWAAPVLNVRQNNATSIAQASMSTSIIASNLIGSSAFPVASMVDTGRQAQGVLSYSVESSSQVLATTTASLGSSMLPTSIMSTVTAQAILVSNPISASVTMASSPLITSSNIPTSTLVAHAAPDLPATVAAALSMASVSGATTPSISPSTSVTPSVLPTSGLSFTAVSTSSMAQASEATESSTSDISAADTSSGLPDKPLVIGYYADWTVSERRPETLDFSKLDIINYAFAIPNERYELTWDDPDSSQNTLRRLVASATKAGKKVVLSIGGWSGSRYFSPAVASDSARRTFVASILKTYRDFRLAGIDLDWEYPGLQGAGNNIVSANDTANFLAFLQLLRKSLPANALLTAAVATYPFVDATGSASKDVSAFAQVLDFVTLMAYDAFGASPTPGPNAPFSNECKNSTQPQANAVSAFESWTEAGFPADQLVLGVASYGYHSTTKATTLRSRGLHSRGGIQAREEDGQVTFNTLIKQGKLVPAPATSTDHPGLQKYVAGPGYVSKWDVCSSTPYLYSAAGGEVNTYDDTVSLRMKALWVKAVGMRGVTMWSLDGDTEKYELLGAMKSILDE